MKPFSTIRIAPMLTASFLLGFFLILCLLCWQYVWAFYWQVSEELVNSLSRVETRLLSRN